MCWTKWTPVPGSVSHPALSSSRDSDGMSVAGQAALRAPEDVGRFDWATSCRRYRDSRFLVFQLPGTGVPGYCVPSLSRLGSYRPPHNKTLVFAEMCWTTW